MKRFRVTIIAICLILAWLGFADLRLLMRNPEALEISIATLEETGAPQEWLKVNDGYQDLFQAINMSGTMDITSFLVPLKSAKNNDEAVVWFETRDPKIISALTTYHFKLETEEKRQEFLDKNQQLFLGPRQLTGMIPDNLVSSSNRKKLVELLQEMNIPSTAETIFISEGKSPEVWRGIFFAVIALIGLAKTLLSFRKKTN